MVTDAPVHLVYEAMRFAHGFSPVFVKGDRKIGEWGLQTMSQV